MTTQLQALLSEIRQCRVCAEHLPAGPRPVLNAHPLSKIAIIGQAPGTKVHASGVPWDDASGRRLREWLGVDDETFYNPVNFAIIPMGFCFPGTGKSGDLPPRPECAPLWHSSILAKLPKLKLTLLVGNYAQKYYLGKAMKKNLTTTVAAWKEYWPQFLPIVHPSPRNVVWQKRNPWFESEVVPELRARVQSLLV